MKKIVLITILFVVAVSCKEDKKQEETVDQAAPVTVSGNFMYYSDAAVFQTKSELFGVVANEKLDDLILQAETLKSEPTDEVAVTLKVLMSKKQVDEEGWENRIEILEINNVSKINPENQSIIKLENLE